MTSTVHDNKVVFVSGANRGIGKAIVEALLKHNVKKIYAGARDAKSIPNFRDSRVVPVELDITNVEQIHKAAALAKDTQILINNAGVLTYASVVTGNKEDLMKDMQVNYFGTLSMVNSFSQVIEQNGGGAIANLNSIVGLASMSALSGYSASKAALHSATQAMRTELKSKNISVHSIFPGPIDTDMAKGIDLPKTSPQITAENILNGIANGKEDIFPDPMSTQLSELWAKDPKGLEKQFASM
jgi:NAD(P)-dependent dehydrogenase (short-subunit alcohol dehydrogenase family)